jgi:YVTN family beta-propeller protein
MRCGRRFDNLTAMGSLVHDSGVRQNGRLRSAMRRSRPRLQSAAAVLLAIGLVAPAGSAAAGYYVYVTNEDSNDLSVIDPAKNAVVATIEVGKRPRGVRVSPDGRYVFTALSGSPKCPPSLPDEECDAMKADRSADGIAMIDAATHTLVRTLPGGSDPEQFDVSPDQTRLYVSNEDAGQATIVDIATGAVTATVPVGLEPEGVRVSPDGSVVLVTSETDHDITFVDAASGDVIDRLDVGLRPRDIVFTPDGRRAFVSAELNHHVAVVDMATRTVVENIELPQQALPMGLAISADARTLYVANGRGRTVSKIDLGSGAVVGDVDVGARPWGIALSPDGGRIYTANGPSNDVTVVDARTLAVIARIPVGKSPWGVAIGPQEPAR